MQIDEQEVARLAREITARQDFENTARRTYRHLLEKGLPEQRDILWRWSQVLRQQNCILNSAAVLVDERKKLAIIPSLPREVQKWNTVLRGQLRKRVRESLRHGNSVHISLPRSLGGYRFRTQFLLMMACPRSERPAGLCVITRDVSKDPSIERRVIEMLDSAATRSGLLIALVTQQEMEKRLEKERAIRKTASRVGHMCASSIYVAQLRLLNVARRLSDKSPEQRLACGAMADLKEALEGLERAKLLDLPVGRFEREFEFGAFVCEVAEDLNKARAERTFRHGRDEIVDSLSIEKCRAKCGIKVIAAQERLRYALRDLIVGTWALTGKERPIGLNLQNGNGKLLLIIDGGRSRIDERINAKRLEESLRDPAVFLHSHDPETRKERGIGFLLAWEVIEDQAKGSVKPKFFDDRRLRFEVRLPSKGGAK